MLEDLETTVKTILHKLNVYNKYKTYLSRKNMYSTVSALIQKQKLMDGQTLPIFIALNQRHSCQLIIAKEIDTSKYTDALQLTTLMATSSIETVYEQMKKKINEEIEIYKEIKNLLSSEFLVLLDIHGKEIDELNQILSEVLSGRRIELIEDNEVITGDMVLITILGRLNNRAIHEEFVLDRLMELKPPKLINKILTLYDANQTLRKTINDTVISFFDNTPKEKRQVSILDFVGKSMQQEVSFKVKVAPRKEFF